MSVEVVALLRVSLERAVVDVPHEVIENRDMLHGVFIRPVPDAVRQELT